MLAKVLEIFIYLTSLQTQWVDRYSFLGYKLTLDVGCVVHPTLVCSLTCKTEGDKFMSFIYSYAFRLYSIIFNHISKDNSIYCSNICFLMLFNQSHYLQVSTYYQSSIYFHSTSRGSWWNNIFWTHALHTIHKGGYTPTPPELLDFNTKCT